MQPNLSVTRLLMPTQVAQNNNKQHSENLETARAVALRTEGRSVDQRVKLLLERPRHPKVQS